MAKSIPGVSMFRKSFENRRPGLSQPAVELGERCLLHIENYRLGQEPPFVNRRTLQAIDAFAGSLRQEAARRD